MCNISPATLGEREEALSLLFQAMPLSERTAHVEELLAAAGRGAISLDDLLIVRDASRIHGTIMYAAQEEGTAFVWPAQIADVTNADAMIDALYEELIRRLDDVNFVSAQAIVEVAAKADRAALDRNGFRHLVDLFYLQRLLSDSLPPRLNTEFEVTAFSAAHNEERFARLVEQTYVETLDCPGFHVNRSGKEALASHRCSGDFSAERWNIYTLEGRDVGLLLLNDHPSQDAWEVVYMGVAADARGHGYGRAMLIDGLHAARDAGRQSMLLAVDAMNEPANRIYSELGFIEVASRAVHLRTRGGDGD